MRITLQSIDEDFAYLAILYGSRREMPTGLIDCIVHFFIVYGELLIIVPCGILMRYRITMLYHIMILYSIRMPEPYHNAPQYRRITAHITV